MEFRGGRCNFGEIHALQSERPEDPVEHAGRGEILFGQGNGEARDLPRDTRGALAEGRPYALEQRLFRNQRDLPDPLGDGQVPASLANPVLKLEVTQLAPGVELHVVDDRALQGDLGAWPEGLPPVDGVLLRSKSHWLLVFDEVQTGFGRTGRLFAFEHSGVVPDVLCLAKSIAGGLPLGATVVRRGIGLEVGTHGSTFGGNPLACAVARATLEVLLDSDLIDGVDRIGSLVLEPLRTRQPGIVRAIRQVGLMIGIQLKQPARPYVRALQERGVLALTAGKIVLRLLPPLVLTDEEATEVGRLLADVLALGED